MWAGGATGAKWVKAKPAGAVARTLPSTATVGEACLGVWGLVWGLGFGFGVWGLGFGVRGFVWGLGCGVYG